MNIVILDGISAKQHDLNFDFLKEFGNVIYYDRTEPKLVIERAKDADIVLLNKIHFTKEVFDGCPKLKLIAVLATGYNVIDCDYAKKRGVVVCNIPGYSTDSVVQQTFAFILECATKVSLYNSDIHKGAWANYPDFCMYSAPIMELAGKTLGIIGYGSIGQKVGSVAEAFGMRVVYNRRHPDEKSLSLDEIYKQSDFITLHCPQTQDNANIINSDSISKMKDGVIIINTARGGLVDENAVIDGLHSKKIAYYCADVLSSEPPINNPIQYEENAIITSHVAWASIEARSRLLKLAYNNIKSFLEGHPINVVNK